MLCIQSGIGVNGTRRVSRLRISKEVEPEPITIAARRTVAGTSDVEEHLLDLEPGPQVFGEVALGDQAREVDDPFDPGLARAIATRTAASRSLVTKSPSSIEWTR